MENVNISIAHSPDSDDAFMFYAFTQEILDTSGLEIKHQLQDIESLNKAAFDSVHEVTALSLHAYAFLHDRYELMPSGASFGDGYGPVVVAREPMEREALSGKMVAIPGELTTAHLALKLWNPEVKTTIVPFDEVLNVVERGEVDAGVVIHEGQLTYGDQGLFKVEDLGEWWQGETGGPLPLGANGIRKDLDPALKARLCRLLTESVDYALTNRAEALGYASRYARGIEDDPERSDRFVGMYVNHWTLDYGDAGRRAVQELLDRGHAAGILPHRVVAEFTDPDA
jgi:1,4-dihydroxy-6-naphthoate synthase